MKESKNYVELIKLTKIDDHLLHAIFCDPKVG
jgi:hypothetical protein